MGFYEKYAKLFSKTLDFGDRFTVKVFDDESDSNESAMWLEGAVYDVTNYIDSEDFELDEDDDYELREVYEKVVKVDVIDFNDAVFFNLPENRQQSCATVLLKNFIKYYKQNYEGQLVVADFANYDLQQKFFTATEKGIFPYDSLLLTREVSKEDYDEDQRFNMENRKTNYSNLEILVEKMNQNGTPTFHENNALYYESGKTIEEIQNSYNSAVDHLAEETGETMPQPVVIRALVRDSGEINFVVPIHENVVLANSNLSYTIGDSSITIQAFGVEEIIQSNIEEFKRVFSSAKTIYTLSLPDYIPVEDYYSNLENKEASKIKRLIKKS